jgi:multiple sugar transport system ATP-binding protein
MACVLIENLSKTFEGPQRARTDALRDFTLSIAEGELLVVLGPSGSGKTTLLRIIAGLEEPTSGTLSIDGKLATILPPQDRDVAMVFQDHALYPHMTVAENLAFGLKLRKIAAPEREARVREAAEWLGLSKLLDRLPEALSGGERQRTALGRALVLRPKLFLLDEPLSNLDAPLRAEMRREIARLHQRSHATTIYVTHDQAEAMSLGNRMAVLKDGVLQQVGNPMELYDCPSNLFVARFIGMPPMNLFHGSFVREGGAVWFQQKGGASPDVLRFIVQTPKTAETAAPQPIQVVLGLRPEHLRLVRNAQSSAPSIPVLGARVTAVEPLGPETYLYLEAGAGEWVARIPPGSQVRIGDMVQVALDIDKGRFFDSQTAQAVC